MLVIDDNMLRLAKMLETLLRVSDANKEENLRKYKEIVSEIDSKAFSDILEEIKCIDKHNHSLETELEFLDGIEKTYNQLFELQTSFKRVCENCGDIDFQLSDLSRLNIDYIRDRKKAIVGYLTNYNNIKINKQKIEELNKKLIDYEKKKSVIDKRLLELEETLRWNFSNCEGRSFRDGRLVPTSVMSEYNKIDLDFNKLKSDGALLDKTISDVTKNKNDALDTLKSAEVCYNNVLTDEIKQFFDEAKSEYIKLEYKLLMLKILKLVSQNYVEYDDVKKKRMDLVTLIDDRFSCLKYLGLADLKNKDLDPFNRMKVREQLEIISTMDNYSKKITDTTDEIKVLFSKIEEMTRQKEINHDVLRETRDLIENRVSMNDIDVSGVYLPVEESVQKDILSNQVINVRDVSSKFNMTIVSQKTSGVIKRVSKMVNRRIVKKNDVSSSVAPELVILPKVSENVETTMIDNNINDSTELDISDNKNDLVVDFGIKTVDKVTNQPLNFDNINNDLFETISPFAEPVMFSDRSDDAETSNKESVKAVDFPVIESVDDVVFPSVNDGSSEQDFWVVQGDNSLSFDEQVQMLMLSEDDNKVKRKTA